MNKYQITILILALLSVVIWVSSDLIKARFRVEISPKLLEAIEPIEPQFDKNTLDLSQARLKRIIEVSPQVSSPSSKPAQKQATSSGNSLKVQ